METARGTVAIWKGSLNWLLIAIVGSAIGIRAGIPGVVIWLLVASFLLSWPLTEAWHEAGHFLAARVVGFQFQYLTLGPLKIERREDRLHAGRSRLGQPHAWPGGCLPLDGRHLRRRYALVAGGGPVSSLTLSVLLAGLYVRAGVPLFSAHTSVAAAFGASLLLTAGAVSFLHFVNVLLPYRTASGFSDGAKLLTAFGGGLQAERRIAIEALLGWCSVGRRPREWSAGLVAAASGLPDGSPDAAAGDLLAYHWLLDRDEALDAGTHIDRALTAAEAHAVAFMPVIQLQAAYYAAWYRRDAVGARAYLDKCRESSLIEPFNRLLTEAAIFLAENDHATAIKRATEALKVIRRSEECRATEYQLRVLNEIVVRCEAGISGRSAGEGSQEKGSRPGEGSP